MKRIETFEPATRYKFDFGSCSPKKGYAQIDTGQDAEYFGMWANPTNKIIFIYVEGDCTTLICESLDEFKEEMMRIKEWHMQSGIPFKGVDPGLNAEAIKKWHDIGLSHLLH